MFCESMDSYNAIEKLESNKSEDVFKKKRLKCGTDTDIITRGYQNWKDAIMALGSWYSVWRGPSKHFSLLRSTKGSSLQLVEASCPCNPKD